MDKQQLDSTPPPPSDQSDTPPLYTLTVDEASRLFTEADTPRSPRTIMRYCAQGHLACIKVDTQYGERYLISRDSVDRRVDEIRQLAVTRHDETRRDMSRHDAPDGKTSHRESGDEDPGLAQRLIELEAQLRDLEITNRAKDYFLEQLKTERAALLDQVSSKSHQIGQLETRLQLNAAPPAAAADPLLTEERTASVDFHDEPSRQD